MNMNNERSSREDLLSYASKHKTKSTSKTAIITELYDDITLAQKEGVSINDLVDFFKTKNITLSSNYLSNILYRIKKKKQQITDLE
ncbi:hypothetical protein [Aliivibrio salmonicida]|uniref:hypothetical protein n=1 Tax=Aliivibrio salmonicida TaxID=40269 RepID=UPI003D0D6EB4